MKYKFILLFIVLFICELHSQVLVARKDTVEFELGEIVVTAKREVIQYSSMTELTTKDFEDRNAVSAGEILKEIPGVHISTGHKNSTEIKIRGFDPEDVLIMMDGRPMNPPYYGKVDLNQIPLDNIKKIKVIKGPASPLYGANSMGGVINIITDTPSPEGEMKFRVLYGNNETSQLNLSYGKSLKDFNYWISIGKGSSRGYNLSKSFTPVSLENGGLRDNSDFNNTNLNTKIGYNISEKLMCTLSAGYYVSEKGLPGSIAEPRFWRFTDWERGYIDFSGKIQLKKNMNLKTKLYYDKFKNRLIDYKDNSYSETDIYFNSLHDNADFGGLINGEYKLSTKNILYFGISAKNDIMDVEDMTTDYSERRNLLTTSYSFQGEYNPLQFFFLTIGSAYNRLIYDDFKRNTSAFSPSINALYHFSDIVSVYASISKETRFPTLHNLYSRTSGNLDLKAENAIKTEFSLEKNFRNNSVFRIDFFRNDVKDLIIRKRFGFKYYNIDKTLFQGFDISYSTKVFKAADVQMNYAYMKTKNSLSGEVVPHNPPHKLNLSIKYDFKYNMSINLFTRYVSETVSFDNEIVGSFHVVDLKIDKRFWNNSVLFVSGKNIFDSNYMEERGYPMQGRSFSVGLSKSL